MPARKALIRLLREAAWAPAAVFAASFLMPRSLYVDRLYGLLHFIGGAAFAFFFLRASVILEGRLGRLRAPGRYFFAFAGSCAVAMLWEIGEFVSDTGFGTVMQKGLWDTMTDLSLAALGAVGFLAVFAFAGRGRQ